MIKKSGGNRIPVVVVPEMRAFCGINATRVANEFGVQIRRMCPIEGFAHSWKGVDSTVKEAIMQAIRDKFQITDEDLVEDSELIEIVSDEKAYKLYKEWKHTMRKHYIQMKEEGLDAYAHPYHGVTEAGWKYLIDNIFDDPKFKKRKTAGAENRKWLAYQHALGSRSMPSQLTMEAGPNKEWPEFCDFWKRTHTSSKTGTWVSHTCEEIHADLEKVRDEGIASGNPLTGEELSRNVLKPNKRHIKGFGIGPRPFSSSSKSDAKFLAQEHQMQELRTEIVTIREEQKKKNEERDKEIADLKILVAKLMNGGGGIQHNDTSDI